MAQGKVNWFNSSNGYGFITNDEDQTDIFVHFSEIKMDGYRTLREGQIVTFEIEDDPKREGKKKAVCVEVIE